jgi:excisionase family DNA binding protein
VLVFVSWPFELANPYFRITSVIIYIVKPRNASDIIGNAVIWREVMEKEDLADDLLKGVEAIANYTGLTKRAVYGLAEKGRLPVFKLDGWKWCARKSTLRKHIDKLEASHV